MEDLMFWVLAVLILLVNLAFLALMGWGIIELVQWVTAQ